MLHGDKQFDRPLRSHIHEKWASRWPRPSFYINAFLPFYRTGRKYHMRGYGQQAILS